MIVINAYLDLFVTFARIGSVMFGGGYAMLPILQRDIVEKRGWATDEEMADYYAIGQCTPGVIAVNTATFIGNKRKGPAGAVCATLGLVAPAIVIICVIAMFLQNFAEYPVVVHAFVGIRACVVALIAGSVLKLKDSSLKGAVSWVIFALVLVASAVWSISPVLLVVLAGLFGYVQMLLHKKKGGKA